MKGRVRRPPAWLITVLLLLLGGAFAVMAILVQPTSKPTGGADEARDAAAPAFEDFQRLPLQVEEISRKPRQADLPPIQPGIALILDDVGYDLNALKRLLALNVPMAVSILPDAPYAAEAGQLAHAAGQTVMLHLPMEPSTPKYREKMDHDFLRSDMTEAELRQTFERNLQQVPFAVGVNNHMGSLLTEDEEKMRLVMEYCRQHDLFFIDSLTSSRSVAAKVASEAGLSWGVRRYFLDHALDQASLNHAWRQALDCAKSGRQCIVIAHPHPETVDFLEQQLSGREWPMLLPLKPVLRTGLMAGGHG